MKKFLFILLVLLIIPISVSAVEITSTPTSATTSVEKSVAYTLKVTNDKADSDRFILTVFGRHLEWANLQGYYFELEPHETKEISLNFYPLEEGSYLYDVQVSSIENPANRDSVLLKLHVKPLVDPDISSFTADLVGNELRLDLTVTSRKRRDMEITFVVKDSEGNTLKAMSITREVEGEKELLETMSLENLQAGAYSVDAELVGYDVKSRSNFYVAPVHNIVTSKKTVSTPLMQEVTITITNKGNVRDDYSLKEKLPAGQYVTLVDNPDAQHIEEDKVLYEWDLTGLAVGQTVEIRYTVDYWKNILGWAIMSFALLGLLGMGVIKVRRPTIRKEYLRKINERKVIIKIKGSLTRELKNVLVRDRVSPLGKVLPEFEGPKPIVRESESGTELIWRLGNVKPRSEIYLSYNIRPLLEAQLKMPRAYLTYRTDDERKVRVYSKQLILE